MTRFSNGFAMPRRFLHQVTFFIYFLIADNVQNNLFHEDINAPGHSISAVSAFENCSKNYSDIKKEN